MNTIAAIVTAALVATGCSGNSSTAPTTVATTTSLTPTTTLAPTTVATIAATTTTVPVPTAPQTVTLRLSTDVRWSDGSTISVADLECTRTAAMVGIDPAARARYGTISAIDVGSSAGTIVVTFSQPVADYRMLFSSIVHAGSTGCPVVMPPPTATTTVATTTTSPRRRTTTLPPVATSTALPATTTAPPRLPVEELTGVGWSLTTALDSGDVSEVSLTRVGAVAGSVNAIVVRDPGGPGAPDPLAGPIGPTTADLVVGDPLSTPLPRGTTAAIGPTGEMASIVLSRRGALADPVLRAAVYHSIDPVQVVAAAFVTRNQAAIAWDCGPWPGTALCSGNAFAGSFDQALSDRTLTAAGWIRNDEGRWARDGVVPRLTFAIPVGDRLAQDVQTSVVLGLSASGFEVIPTTCDERCLTSSDPASTFDLTMATSDSNSVGSAVDLLACGATDAPGLGPCGDPVVRAVDATRRAAPTTSETDTTASAAATATSAAALASAAAADALIVPLSTVVRSVRWRTARFSAAIDPVVASSATDLLASVTRWLPRGSRSVAIVVERPVGCRGLWWQCPASGAQALRQSALAPGLWTPTRAGREPSTLLAAPEFVKRPAR